MQTLMLQHLKGLLAPFVSAVKGIKFLSAGCKKGLLQHAKLKKSTKIKQYCNTFSKKGY
jgi:hypothetical protein